MSKQSIKATIDANIKQNGVQAITGQIMNSVLNQMVDNLAEEASTTEKLSELESEVIYDVTANNSGATFASLSALLSSEDLSTLIPITARCGGMSIRFVKSSDNIYIQYRLMKNTWSTNISDWYKESVDVQQIFNTGIDVLNINDINYPLCSGIKSISYYTAQYLTFNSDTNVIIYDGNQGNYLIGYIKAKKGHTYNLYAKFLAAGLTSFIRVGYTNDVPHEGVAVNVQYVASSEEETVLESFTPQEDCYLVFRWYRGSHSIILGESISDTLDNFPSKNELVRQYTNKILRKSYIDASGNLAQNTILDAYHYPLKNGERYHVRQQKLKDSESEPTWSRIFILDNNVYTQVYATQDVDFDYDCPNSGTYIIQTVNKLTMDAIGVSKVFLYNDINNVVENLVEISNDKILKYDNYTSEECINRFVDELNSRITQYGNSESGITTPWGRYDSVVNIESILKWTATALGYNFICQIDSVPYRIIKTSQRTITINSTTYTNPYVNDYIGSYTPLVHKTGTSDSTANFTCVCTSNSLNGRLLVGTIITSAALLQSSEVNRYKCMKILLDIGSTLLNNPSADISTLQSQLIEQYIISAQVAVMPNCNPLSLHHWDISSFGTLYTYNKTNVQHYSTIKLLSAQVMIDYLADKLEYNVVIDADDATCPEISGFNLNEGEIWKLRDLFYAILLDSNNQATKVIAKRVGAILLESDY